MTRWGVATREAPGGVSESENCRAGSLSDDRDAHDESPRGSLSERRDIPGLDGTVLAVVEDELEDASGENVIEVREDRIGLKVVEIRTWSILAQVDEDRALPLVTAMRRAGALIMMGAINYPKDLPCWRRCQCGQQYCHGARRGWSVMPRARPTLAVPPWSIVAG